MVPSATLSGTHGHGRHPRPCAHTGRVFVCNCYSLVCFLWYTREIPKTDMAGNWREAMAAALAMAGARGHGRHLWPWAAGTQRPCARMSGTSLKGKAASRVQYTNTISMAIGSPRWKKKRQLLENVFHTCQARRGRRRPKELQHNERTSMTASFGMLRTTSH